MKINFGCGNKCKEGFWGIDKYACEAVDQIVDLNHELPFEDSAVEEAWLDNVIEHIEDIPRLMGEIHRVCKNGAKVTLITPHYSSAASWRDPTHFHHLSYFSMDHFEKPEAAYYIGGGFKVVRRKLSFGGGVMGALGRLIFAVSPRQYELQWCFIFRASTLHFELEVVKPG